MTTSVRKAKRLTAEEEKVLLPAIRSVWAYIGYDCPTESNAEAIECSIDADRLTSIANNPEATNVVRKLVSEMGYDSALRAIGKSIRLV